MEMINAKLIDGEDEVGLYVDIMIDPSDEYAEFEDEIGKFLGEYLDSEGCDPDEFVGFLKELEESGKPYIFVTPLKDRFRAYYLQSEIISNLKKYSLDPSDYYLNYSEHLENYFYLQTSYRCPEIDVELKIAEQTQTIQDYMQKNNHQDYCFITAWNPMSKQLSKDENDLRNQQLLKEFNTTYFDGVGSYKEWSEDSFLVFDLGKDKALELKDKYEQKAIVFGELQGVSKLLV